MPNKGLFVLQRKLSITEKQSHYRYLSTTQAQMIIRKVDEAMKSIPIARLRDRISYLAEQIGIKTQVINEAYTSKSSYLDQDEFVKGDFSSVRVKRGLYKRQKGILINKLKTAVLSVQIKMPH
jgi:hypothetical protein